MSEYSLTHYIKLYLAALAGEKSGLRCAIRIVDAERMARLEAIEGWAKEWLPRIQEAANDSPNQEAYSIGGRLAEVMAYELQQIMQEVE